MNQENKLSPTLPEPSATPLGEMNIPEPRQQSYVILYIVSYILIETYHIIKRVAYSLPIMVPTMRETPLMSPTRFFSPTVSDVPREVANERLDSARRRLAMSASFSLTRAKERII